jgi:DinB superfamily
MHETHRIADSYHAVTIKGAWYGPSLAELLAEMSPELATAPPTPGAHTISALLQHLLLWNERVRNTLPLRNDAAPARATRDIPFWAGRDGLEHAPVPDPLAPTARGRYHCWDAKDRALATTSRSLG